MACGVAGILAGGYTTDQQASSRWYHLIVAAFPALGPVIQLVLLLAGGADVGSGASGRTAPLGTRLIRFFSYFTIRSNLLVSPSP